MYSIMCGVLKYHTKYQNLFESVKKCEMFMDVNVTFKLFSYFFMKH